MPKEVNQQSERIPIWVSLLLTKNYFIGQCDNYVSAFDCCHQWPQTSLLLSHYTFTTYYPPLLDRPILHVSTRLVSFIHFQYHQRCSIFIEWNRCKICTFIRILWIFIILHRMPLNIDKGELIYQRILYLPNRL